ncbi:MAG: hypothetical protein C4547_04955 [Phycisphaerales bacterium]|nr:MAG: hypothetical protein C4547_04955 [Phycisphaerales bacterium]
MPLDLSGSVAGVRFTAEGDIDTDVACRRCGYNLRGLLRDDRCPECGSPAVLALQGDRIRFGDPGWVDRLAKGVRLVVWGIVLAFLSGLAGAVSSTVILATIVTVLASLMRCCGVWLLTSPDPSGLGEASYATSRKVVRIAAVIGLVGAAVGGFGGSMALTLLTGTLGVAATLAGVIEQIATLLFLEKLCRRIPDKKLAGRARVIRCGILFGYAFMLVGGIVTALTLATAGPSGIGAPVGLSAGALGCVMGVGGLTLLVFGILYLLFMIRLGRALGVEARRARELWSASAPASPASPSGAEAAQPA